MMDMVQTAAVATANVVLPGSGAIINSAFELGKVCYEIGLVLNGMQKSAPSIKTQHANTEEDVSYFSWVLEVLEQRVQNQELFTRELQKLISKFETEVKEYDRVMKKFLNKSALKQLVFHSDLDTVSTRTRKIAKDLCERINTESSISASAAYAKQEKRAERYMKIVDSPEVVNAMSDPDNQKEILAIITRMGRRNEAMMQSPIDTNDIVLNVMKEKLWASSSRAIRADISNLPDWYITEDDIDIDIDMSTVVGFGGDAKMEKTSFHSFAGYFPFSADTLHSGQINYILDGLISFSVFIRVRPQRDRLHPKRSEGLQWSARGPE